MLACITGNFLMYCVINAFTPGPGNILALNTVTVYGLKKGRPLFLGIFAGYYGVQTLCAIFVYGVSTFLPEAMSVLKYVGAVYILWLAVHIARSTPQEEAGDKSASFWKGFMLQFVNVKIYMFGITALTGFIVDYSTKFAVLLFSGYAIVVIGITATCTWIWLGMVIQKWYRSHFRAVNMILALLLLECAVSMLR